jgi:AcrR family transcriptional regulator
MTKKLLSKAERKASLIKAGVALLASGTPWPKLSCAKVAEADGVSAPLVFHIFGSRKALHKAIKAAYK